MGRHGLFSEIPDSRRHSFALARRHAATGEYFSLEDRVKAGIIAVVAAVDAMWIALAGYSFDMSSIIRLIVVVSFLLAVAEIYRRWRPIHKFVVITRETGRDARGRIGFSPS